MQFQKQPSPGRGGGVGGKRGSVGVEGFDDASDDGSEASSISSVGVGNNHLSSGGPMKPRYLQSPNQAHPRVTPTSSSTSASAGRFPDPRKGQQSKDLVYERENLNPEEVHMSLR